ncbi:hypothetical protein [Kiloniella sp.]|uniref:phage major capsid protein n=1 Tax=Kiloniella sp. TaxID=1938587 RepID=UPI003B02BBE3
MESAQQGMNLAREASAYGLNLRDYLQLACSPVDGLNGYEAALQHLNLPVNDNFDAGVTLQAASNTFQTYSGTRALFKEVLDDVIRWKNRQTNFENIAAIVSNSRTISGNELVSTIVNDDSDSRGTYTVAEGGRIPVRTIRTSETSVRMYKHGGGIRTTYEFNRRAALELVVPYLARVQRELEASKVDAAMGIILNGDGVNGAAPVVGQSGYDGNTGVTATNGKISIDHLLYWLVMRAKAGAPVDTIVGNWDTAFKYARLWSTQGSDTKADAENFQTMANKFADGMIEIPLPKFALSSSVSANNLVGITKAETVEELIEAGSDIEETERNVNNQTISVYHTENSGFRMLFDDTRSVFDYSS